MIICQNASSGNFQFVWDGGLTAISAHASAWGSGSFSLKWTDEFGTDWFFTPFNSTNSDLFNPNFVLPPGNYTLIINGTVTGLNVAIRKVPA